MRTERETANVLIRGARAIAAMNDSWNAALESEDAFWLATRGQQAYAHQVQGQAFLATARDLGAPEALVRAAAAGDLKTVEGGL